MTLAGAVLEHAERQIGTRLVDAVVRALARGATPDALTLASLVSAEDLAALQRAAALVASELACGEPDCPF